MAATAPMSQDQDRSDDIKMDGAPTSSTSSSLQSIPAPIPPSTYDPYKINQHIVRYDPVDSRELQRLFGEDRYMFFKKDTRQPIPVTTIYYIRELISTLMNGNMDQDLSTSLTDHITCIKPKKKGGFAVSCTYRFVHDIDKPGEIIKIYDLLDKYLTNNDSICNYIGSDQNCRCHFHTNRDQIYKHTYIIHNIPLHITSLGLYDKENVVKVTEFINTAITTQIHAGRYRWERRKSHHSGLITQSIELETLKPIIIANKQVTTVEINWMVAGQRSKRKIKIINTERQQQQPESFKIYAPEDVETNFMRIRREFEEKYDEQQIQERERAISIVNEEYMDKRKSDENSRQLLESLADIRDHNNNDHNHNNNNMEMDHHDQEQQQHNVDEFDMDVDAMENYYKIIIIIRQANFQ